MKTESVGLVSEPDLLILEMQAVDSQIGIQGPGPRNPQVSTPKDFDHRMQKLSEAVRIIIECIGEDCTREGLKDTPERYARAMLFFTKGYEENIQDIINGAIFQEDHHELVIVKDISIFSLCEHHMIPFMGKVGDSDDQNYMPC